MIPGMNVLKVALSAINSQQVTYYKFLNRTTNAIAYNVTSYENPITIAGSFQPVPRQLYTLYGLDLEKQYFTFYTPVGIIDVQRDKSGDKIQYNSKEYQCESNNDWFATDGWVGVLCVYIKDV